MRWARWRWRIRGAWLWPTFAVATGFDAFLLHANPVAGDATRLLPALLLAAAINIAAVAVIAPMIGYLLRRRWPGVPKVVADSRAGTALLIAIALLIAVVGLSRRPDVEAAKRDFARAATLAHVYLATHAPLEFRARLAGADSMRIDDHLYRTCVPGPDLRRAACAYVDTTHSTPSVRLDPSRQTNASFRGLR